MLSPSGCRFCSADLGNGKQGDGMHALLTKSSISDRMSAILESIDSPHQTIELVKDRSGIVLLLNGVPQVHSSEELLYYECVATIPLMLAWQVQRTVILGGGDGLAAREVVRFEDAEHVTIVERDPEIIRLCSQRTEWVKLSEGSLCNPKLKLLISDPIPWLSRSRTTFDVILYGLNTDEGAPNADALACVAAKLSPGGVCSLTCPQTGQEAQRTRSLLEEQFAWVRQWRIDFPLRGSQTTFFMSNAALTGSRRQPSTPPIYVDEHVMRELLK